jgi:membrane protease YdiL (CAAX protease family)
VLAAAARFAPRGGGAFTVLAAAWALALALHVVPGFHNPVLLAGVRFTPDAVPFTVSLSFDKAAAGLVLVAAFCRPGRRLDGRPWAARTLAGALASCIVVIGLAVAIGYTRFEPKWPDAAPAFLAGNLLFTCVAEEAFFRGLIQERIERLADAGGRAAWRAVAVVTGAVLFGLAHAGGGTSFMLLATVAGLGYGLTYSATRRIESAILAHFALNAVHFVGFAYPALAR